ncbi:DUF3857 domain-containing protein [Gramella sp. GC03-9]|uniref:DUF3857 domain-containing protein n=1 Tax=Christiangramia oceanisediminis TaxID=2920386 RepID=A0A9X2I5G6_9FLAO|nr:DUF3857 domain-containing protein [Gramella oceanisediminis]MCP9199757.1 DUF3857 domain-containing protein [Gramella oceanisediminis]
MSKFFLSIALLLAVLTSQSQNYNSANATVSIFDMSATTYAKDTTANALYIYEEGFSEFQPKHDYDLVTNYTAKLKILNKEGLEHATVEIPVSKGKTSSEKIINLKAYTYNYINGVKTQYRLNPEKVYREEFETYDILKFTFPNAQPGSVLVYSYELVSPFIFDFHTWHFQDYIPKIYSKFTAKIPGNYEYYVTKRGELDLKSVNSRIIERCISFSSRSEPAGCGETVYDMENIPAFKVEEYLTSERNFKSRVEFELIQITRLDGYERKFTRSWADVDKEIEKVSDIGKQLGKTRLVEDLLPGEIISMPNNLEKATKIYQFVQKNYSWNGEYRIHADMNLKDILEDQSGNVLAVNTLLHNLYVTEGFKVYPVLASTRNNGFAGKVHPVLSDFNYFFIQLVLDKKEFLLDATEKNLDFGRLPFRALNQYARKMDFEKGSSWLEIVPQDYSQITFIDSLKVQPDGTALGQSRQIMTGYHALNFRDHMKEASEEEIFNIVSKPNDHTRAIETIFENEEAPEENLFITYGLENKSQKIEDRIYLNPFSFKFFDGNPFKLDERHYPVDFGYKDLYSYTVFLEIPENYSIEEFPEKKAITMPGNGGTLMFSTQQLDDHTLSVVCRLSFKSAMYPSVMYDGLKQFFDEIMQVQTQSLIVLKKIS